MIRAVIAKNFPKRFSLFLTIFVIGIIGFSITASANDSVIPEWVKNNAKWWSEGSISESEYVSSIQFLINHGILKIPVPITEVVAASTSLSDEERAQSFVVHFKGGFLTETFTVDTFSKYEVISQRTDGNIAFFNIYKVGEKAEFFLEGLPNKNFSPAYKTINKWLEEGPLKTEPFDVDIDVVAGDGTVILRWAYQDCKITGYGTFLQDIKNLYSYTDKEQAEIRERITFACPRPDLIVP